MTKKLHYLFLMSLLGTSSMTNAASSVGHEPPTQGVQTKVLPKTKASPAKKRIHLPMTSFSQDIKNLPFLWGPLSLLSAATPFLELIPSLGKIVKHFNWWGVLDISIYVIPTAKDSGMTKKTKFAYLGDFLRAFGKYFCAELILYTILSILLASWATLWMDKTKKGEAAIKPSWKVRFWRASRVIFSVITLRILLIFIYGFHRFHSTWRYSRYMDDTISGELKLAFMFFFPFIGFSALYAGLKAYDYWRKKALQKKKDTAIVGLN